MGRKLTDSEEHMQRVKELTTLKMQLDSNLLSIPELIQGFAEASPWAARRPFVMLFMAGQVERARKYLEGDIENFNPKNQPRSIREAFGSGLGDPEDEIRRKQFLEDERERRKREKKNGK